MKNNGENLKLFAAFLLLCATVVCCIVSQVQSQQPVEVNCGCGTELISAFNETLDAHTNEIISKVKSDNTSAEAESEETSEPETPKSDIPIIKEPVSEVSNPTDSARFEVGESVPLPPLPTHVKLCTDYRCYNLWYTPHYRMQQAAYTDKNGLRRYGDDYIVGLGKFYSEAIGDRFEVTLDTGRVFTVIFGDGKAPVDCDSNNMYTPCKNYNGEDCANVLEFIMDKYAMSGEVYSYGSIDCLDEFKGNIVEMKYLGRDNSADWDTYETR